MVNTTHNKMGGDLNAKYAYALTETCQEFQRLCEHSLSDITTYTWRVEKGEHLAKCLHRGCRNMRESWAKHPYLKSYVEARL